MIRKARDLALDAIREGHVAAAPEARPGEEIAGEGLSEEDRAMIEHALSGTTGVGRVAPARLKELGLEERYVPAADPTLQVDVLPDQEPLTHLPSPWKSRG